MNNTRPGIQLSDLVVALLVALFVLIMFAVPEARAWALGNVRAVLNFLGLVRDAAWGALPWNL